MKGPVNDPGQSPKDPLTHPTSLSPGPQTTKKARAPVPVSALLQITGVSVGDGNGSALISYIKRTPRGRSQAAREPMGTLRRRGLR